MSLKDKYFLNTKISKDILRIHDKYLWRGYIPKKILIKITNIYNQNFLIKNDISEKNCIEYLDKLFSCLEFVFKSNWNYKKMYIDKESSSTICNNPDYGKCY